MTNISYNFIKNFKCLQDKCPDTCCKNWLMQVNDNIYNKYKNEQAELLGSIEKNNNLLIMKKDPTTGFCVKFDNGICSIHQNYGEEFLGDACNFYPRIHRKYNNDIYKTACLSCPEIVNQIFFTDNPFDKITLESIIKLPEDIKDYTNVQDLPNIQQKIINYIEHNNANADEILINLINISESLYYISPSNWGQAIDIYIKNPISITYSPTNIKLHDILIVIQSLLIITKSINFLELSERFNKIKSLIENSLDIRINHHDSSINILNTNIDLNKILQPQIERKNSIYKILKTWLLAQVIIDIFPIASAGENIKERINIIAIKYIYLKIILLCFNDQKLLDKEHIILVVQTLSKFIDHMNDSKNFLKINNMLGIDKNFIVNLIISMNYTLNSVS